MLTLLFAAAGCFNPESISGDTDAVMSTTGSMSTGAQTTGPDSAPPGVTDTGSSGLPPATDSASSQTTSGGPSGDPSETSDSEADPTSTDSGTTGGDEATSSDAATSSDEVTGETGALVCTVVADQAATDEDDSLNYPAWQSFTVGTSGALVEVDAVPNTFCGGSGIAGQLTILEGQGLGGDVLHQQDYPAVSMSGLNLVTFVVDPPVSVEAGQQYTWSLTGTCGLRHSNDDPYPGGIGGGVANVDMVFETRIEVCE